MQTIQLTYTLRPTQCTEISNISKSQKCCNQHVDAHHRKYRLRAEYRMNLKSMFNTHKTYPVHGMNTIMYQQHNPRYNPRYYISMKKTFKIFHDLLIHQVFPSSWLIYMYIMKYLSSACRSKNCSITYTQYSYSGRIPPTFHASLLLNKETILR